MERFLTFAYRLTNRKLAEDAAAGYSDDVLAQGHFALGWRCFCAGMPTPPAKWGYEKPAAHFTAGYIAARDVRDD